MTTSRLAKGETALALPEDRDERLRFLIDQGNQKAAEVGRHDVEWVIKGGELRPQFKRGVRS